LSALDDLVAATAAALDDPSLPDDRARCDAIRPAMAALLAADDPVPAASRESLNGEAVGNVVYSDPDGRFHVMVVVFPEGTSSGVHHHGCWGLIGYLNGSDEETRYRAVSDDGTTADVEEVSRHRWTQGDITALLPPDEGLRATGRENGSPGQGASEGAWHRVRSAGPGDGVSVHVLCMTPGDHPHRFWDRSTGRVYQFPFMEVAPDRWRAEVVRD
jgi:predicted metal-dependent enzyme (double-stranded beta helix superfamily)